MPLHRALTVLAALGAAVVLAVPLFSPSVSAATPTGATGVVVDQSYPVPASGAFTLRGHGFGHGHGMSQYGAYGAARQGLGYREIIGFYYPGTSWSQDDGLLRVLITADTTPDLVVSPARGLRVRDLGSGRVYPLPVIPGVRRWRLDVDGTRSVVGYLTSSWHRYRPGGRDALVGDGRFAADEPLTLWTPSGGRSYRGRLRAASPAPGSADRDTVDVVSLDDYVRGVVPAEMPASWSPAAVQAQAVAARTYAAWSRAQAPHRYWHICDTPACQAYGGVALEDPRGDAAVAATSGLVLRYGGEPAFTQFSSSDGGWSTAGGAPYLVARRDPYDGFAANPVHDWTLSLSAASITSAYPSIGRLQRLHVTRRDGHGEWGGRVLTVVLDGSRRDVTLSGDDFRSVFGLRSTWFRA
jgi:SpoIID/LytB domain protein